MTDEQRELVNQLFAAATAILEDAIEQATAGQSPALRPHELDCRVARLQECSREITTLSQTALVIANIGANQDTRGEQK